MSEGTGPHSRFPWGPALLSAACLAMAACTWMRYSYAWELTPKGLGSFVPRYRHDMIWTPAVTEPSAWPVGSFVRLTQRPGVADVLADPLYILSPLQQERPLPMMRLEVTLCPDEDGLHWSGSDASGGADHRHFYGRVAPPPPRQLMLWWPGHLGALPEGVPFIRAGASRLTGESVAGLVVGAMGAVVFGLYLRRWLVARKAVA